MKKIIIVVILVALIMGAGITTYVLLQSKDDLNKENNVQIVKLNEEIVLRKNEKVEIEGTNAQITIIAFTDSPTPEGSQSIWSGQGVTYELQVGDEVYRSSFMGLFNEDDNVPYNIKTIESDYKTYAKVKVTKRENIEPDESTEMQEVDDYIDKILNDENFKKMSKEERISYMENELKKLATEGTEKIKKSLIRISSIYVDNENNQYNTIISFQYASGILGGVMIPNEFELTYKINNEMQSYNSRYSERGVYYDTLNTLNAPSYYIIAMGEQNTGGYTINVKEVNIDEEENVEIIVVEEEPAAEETVTMSLTYPVCSVEFSNGPKSVVVKNTKGKIFKSANY